MTETLAAISSPHFFAGIVLFDNRVVEAAPILHYMKRGKWSRDRVREYCACKGWHVTVVHQVERDRP